MIGAWPHRHGLEQEAIGTTGLLHQVQRVSSTIAWLLVGKPLDTQECGHYRNTGGDFSPSMIRRVEKSASFIAKPHLKYLQSAGCSIPSWGSGQDPSLPPHLHIPLAAAVQCPAPISVEEASKRNAAHSSAMPAAKCSTPIDFRKHCPQAQQR